MIYKIVHFSEADFGETAVIQIQDELVEGDKVFISKDHELTIEFIKESGKELTIIDGDKILRLISVN